MTRHWAGWPVWWWLALAVAAVATGALWPYAWTAA